MFQHFLITRFNLKNPKWDVTKNNEELLNDAWMQDRMKLFSNFCFPSVVSQTNKNFTWLLYFDSSTKAIFKDQIENLTSNNSNIKVFYIDGMSNFYPEIQKYITENATKSDYLITSRIDNDDCIHKDFIDEVQKKFNHQEYEAVDIIQGYSLQVEPQFILGKKEHIFNPFISLIEKNDAPKTVWMNDHTMWKKETRITQIDNKRLWMSIIHQKNKVNEFDGYDNVLWKDINDDFIVSDEMNVQISQNFLPFKEWWFLSLKNKIYVKMVLFSKKLKKAIGIYRIK